VLVLEEIDHGQKGHLIPAALPSPRQASSPELLGVEEASGEHRVHTAATALTPRRRPQTHCGRVQHPRSRGCSADRAPDGEPPEGRESAESACSAEGAAAYERSNGCASCGKLLLRLEHAERARVKAQEQLAKFQAENMQRARPSTSLPSSPRMMVSPRCSSASPDGMERAEAAVVESPVDLARPNTGAGPLAAEEDVGRSLESYRREVAILRNSLKRRDAREAELVEAQRKLRSDHEAAKQGWEEQVAGLVCEVQDLESRNNELEAALQALMARNGN